MYVLWGVYCEAFQDTDYHNHFVLVTIFTPINATQLQWENKINDME